MIGAIVYLAICLVASAVITIVIAMFRSVKSRDEWKSWQCMAIFFFLCSISPYAWTEIQTKNSSKDVKAAIIEGVAESGLEGKLAYYKVLSSKDGKAKTVAVIIEEEAGVGTQRAVVSVNLKQGKKGWEPETFKVVNSDRLNKDGFTMPPFY